MLKSIWAVLAGFLVVVVLSLVTDAFLGSLGIILSGGSGSPSFYEYMSISLVYRTIYAIAGGYITASLAPDRSGRHVMILGILGVGVWLSSLISNWGQNLGPVWYPIALVVLAYPSVWLGGKLRNNN